ncbi:MAG: alkene reductase [Cytophagales bacterium]|nr:alkene reductase [Cytophagales bacterium]
MTDKLFSDFQLGSFRLSNRIVMAPMTRSRADGNVPNALMASYYGQRATAGLIITEGTAPSPDALGYSRIPGIFNAAQVAGWRAVTEAVHARGSRIFVQLMHTGRIGHPLNLPAGARLVAPSAVVANGQIWTDQEGLKPHPVPEALTAEEVQDVIGKFVAAARLAIEAGFDGVELHGANGYLLEQFLNPASNQRTDAYGGSVQNRARFVLETARQVAAAIGRDRVGVRLSPYGVYNDQPLYESIDETYACLARELNAAGIAYLHLMNGGVPETQAATRNLYAIIRKAFPGPLILCGDYDRTRAEADLQSGLADLVAFGRPFVSNPDLPERLRTGAELAAPDPTTFFAGGNKGYLDYPVLQVQETY